MEAATEPLTQPSMSEDACLRLCLPTYPTLRWYAPSWAPCPMPHAGRHGPRGSPVGQQGHVCAAARLRQVRFVRHAH